MCRRGRGAPPTASGGEICHGGGSMMISRNREEGKYEKQLRLGYWIFVRGSTTERKRSPGQALAQGTEKSSGKVTQNPGKTHASYPFFPSDFDLPRSCHYGLYKTTAPVDDQDNQWELESTAAAHAMRRLLLLLISGCLPRRRRRGREGCRRPHNTPPSQHPPPRRQFP